jgi:hypothetical protein
MTDKATNRLLVVKGLNFWCANSTGLRIVLSERNR